MGINFERAKDFLCRTGKKEREPTRPLGKLSPPVRKLLLSIFTFLAVPAITILILWLLEMAQIYGSESPGQLAWNKVFECEDFIFLVFSLAFGVILEWLLSDARLVTPWLIFAEVIIGMISLILYAIEEMIISNTSDTSLMATNALMMNRFYLHISLFFAVGVVAMAGYFQRYKVEKHSKRLRGNR